MSGLRPRRQFLLVCRSGKDDAGRNPSQNYSRNTFSRKLLDSKHIGPHFSGSDCLDTSLLPAIITFSAGGKSISIALRKRPPIPRYSQVLTSRCAITMSASGGISPAGNVLMSNVRCDFGFSTEMERSADG